MTGRNSLLRLTSRLMAQRDALRRVLAEDVSRLREPSEVVGFGDTADAAVDSANDEICSRLAELESRELAGIEQAIQRIAEGRYGRCEACGDRIPTSRLVALPCTSRCIGCQRRDERLSRSPATAAGSRRWERVEDEPGPGDVGEVEWGGWSARGFAPEELAGMSLVRDTRIA